jgi:hypothetical protein
MDTGRHVRPIRELPVAAVVQLEALRVLVAEVVVGHQHALREHQPRQRQPPAGHADHRRVEPHVHIVDLSLNRIVLEPRAPGQRGQIDPLPRGDVVGQAGLRIRESEADGAVGQAVENQVEIRLARGDQPGPALTAADRSFRHSGRIRPAHRDVEQTALPRSFAQPEIHLRAGVAGVALGITAVEERHIVQHVAVDHRDRAGGPAVLDAAHGVQEVRRGEAVHREGQVAEITPADRELAAEVVSGGHAGQDLHGPERIVGEDAAEVLELGAAQHMGRGHGIGRRPEDVRGDRHALAVGGRPLAETHRYGRRARPHGHLAAEQGVAHDGDVEAMGARRQAVDAEAALSVRQDRFPGVLDDDQHLLEGSPRPGVHDLPGQGQTGVRPGSDPGLTPSRESGEGPQKGDQPKL